MERISVFDFTGEHSAEQQVGGAVTTLLAQNRLLLPDFIRAQLEESILRAIGDFAAGQRGAPAPAGMVQIGIHSSDAPSQEASARWGFFLVQKRGEPQDAAGLYLDVYVYQE